VKTPGADQAPGCAGEGAASTAPEPSATFLTLPAPPSANTLFKNVPGKGRVRTPLYDTWLANAGWKLRLQNPETVHGPVLIIIGIERTSAMADIDNRVKATLDLLVKHKVIDDDRHVAGIAIAWNPPRDGLMRIAIQSAGPMVLRFQPASSGPLGGWFIEGPQPEEEVA
jgi:Holliday junction resolvase RusA-like endonuclease